VSSRGRDDHIVFVIFHKNWRHRCSSSSNLAHTSSASSSTRSLCAPLNHNAPRKTLGNTARAPILGVTATPSPQPPVKSPTPKTKQAAIQALAIQTQLCLHRLAPSRAVNAAAMLIPSIRN
jgi:hypothetical protein